MSIQAVNAIIARSVVDTRFLEQLCTKPHSVLAGYQLTDQEMTEFNNLNREHLRQFVGFITKVQNNHLYTSFPLTRLLLTHYGIEHEVFLGFHSQHQQLRADKETSRQARTEAFIHYFEVKLDHMDGEQAVILSNCLLNEKLLLRVRESWKQYQEDTAQVSQTDSGWKIDLEEIHRLPDNQFFSLAWELSPTFYAGEFAFNPNELSLIMSRDGGDLSAIVFQDQLIGYWIPYGETQIRQLNLTAATHTLLGAVNRGKSLKEIQQEVETLLGEFLDCDEVRAFWQAAFLHGLVTLDSTCHPITLSGGFN
jgi:hypothetical protein